MLEALQFEFMQNAFLAGLLASAICGIIGTLVVVNRLAFLAGGIAHAAYGGIGLALYFNWNYMAGTLGFSLTAGMTMAAVSQRAKHRSDTVIGVIWAVGMAFGVILTDLAPGYNVDLMSFLFGSILSVARADLWLMLGVLGFISAATAYFYSDLLAMSYDEEFARARGVRVKLLYFLLIGMLAVSVVMIIQIVGLILVIALLTIPPYIVEKHTKSLAGMMVWASVISAVFVVAGLWLSYRFNLTSGATIILVAGISFFLAVFINRRRRPTDLHDEENRAPEPACAPEKKHVPRM